MGDGWDSGKADPVGDVLRMVEHMRAWKSPEPPVALVTRFELEWLRHGFGEDFREIGPNRYTVTVWLTELKAEGGTALVYHLAVVDDPPPVGVMVFADAPPQSADAWEFGSQDPEGDVRRTLERFERDGWPEVWTYPWG